MEAAAVTPSHHEEVLDVSSDARLPSYLKLVGSEEPAVLADLREETAAAFPVGVASGVQQGRLLHTLVRLSRAKRVVEVGCFTGYSALWMALGLPTDGTLLSLERDEGAAEVARKHLESAGVADRVELRSGSDYCQMLDGAGDVDVAVWHGMDDNQTLLNALLNRLSPHGVLVLLEPTVEDELLSAALEADPSLRRVSLPAPDGTGGLFTLVSRAPEEALRSWDA